VIRNSDWEKSVSRGNLLKMKKVELRITYWANSARSLHRTLVNLFKQPDEQHVNWRFNICRSL